MLVWFWFVCIDKGVGCPKQIWACSQFPLNKQRNLNVLGKARIGYVPFLENFIEDL